MSQESEDRAAIVQIIADSRRAQREGKPEMMLRHCLPDVVNVIANQTNDPRKWLIVISDAGEMRNFLSSPRPAPEDVTLEHLDVRNDQALAVVTLWDYHRAVWFFTRREGVWKIRSILGYLPAEIVIV